MLTSCWTPLRWTVLCDSYSIASLWSEKTPAFYLFISLPAGVQEFPVGPFPAHLSFSFHITFSLWPLAPKAPTTPVCSTCTTCWPCLFFQIYFYICTPTKILPVVKVKFLCEIVNYTNNTSILNKLFDRISLFSLLIVILLFLGGEIIFNLALCNTIDCYTMVNS